MMHAHMAAAYSARPLIAINQSYPINSFTGYQNYPYVNRGVYGGWTGVNYMPPGAVGANNLCGQNWVRPVPCELQYNNVPPTCLGTFSAPARLYNIDNFYKHPRNPGSVSPSFNTQTPSRSKKVPPGENARNANFRHSSTSSKVLNPSRTSPPGEDDSSAEVQKHKDMSYEGMPFEQMCKVFGLSNKKLVKKTEKFNPSWNQMKALIEFKVIFLLVSFNVSQHIGNT